MKTWDTMDAGERDALVGKAIGWQCPRCVDGMLPKWSDADYERIKAIWAQCGCGGSLPNKQPDFPCDHQPHYSTAIADAWLVVEKMREMGHNCQIEAGAAQPEWIACFLTPHGYREGRAPTASAAICLAALRALGAIS